jgi:hypothetical protein
MLMEEWYYADNGQQMGPVSTSELRALLAKGVVKSSDLVWRDGLSNWIPASQTRELCAVAPAAPAPRPGGAAAPSPAKRRYDQTSPARAQSPFDDNPPRDPWDDRPIRRRPPPGMSTAAKVVIFGGIAAVLLMGFVVLVGMAMMAADDRQSTPVGGGPLRQGPRGGAGGPPVVVQDGRAPMPPRISPDPAEFEREVMSKRRAQLESYEVAFDFPRAENERWVSWNANQMVRVTVEALEWFVDQKGDIDLDLYIYNNAGQLIAWDNRPDRDCGVTFIVPADGKYRIVVVLDRGQSAKCIVRH